MTTTNAELIATATAFKAAMSDANTDAPAPGSILDLWLRTADALEAEERAHGHAADRVLALSAQLEAATTITDEQVERAAKALFSIEEPDRNAFRWNREHPTEGLAWHGYWLDAARAALTAALTEGERR